MEGNYEKGTRAPVGEGTPLSISEQPETEAALDIIRTETVLSKLPLHNLAKKGRVDIQIKKVGPNGETELLWELSYSDRYGQARQLAYKLDTIVIDDRIEAAGKPLPERICLGSLNEICRDLNIPEGGSNIKTLKRAFRQNAFLGITAKIKYKGNDGKEYTLDTSFTRYSVIFTGEKLPDGTKADAVYITFNPDFRQVLNNAPVRPLNRAYMKELPPAAQRFYEIVSFKIFAALKYNHPDAKLAYSEYCVASTQQRYFDYDHFKKQMYKVHRPHLQSGYISKIHYQETTDSEKKRDWIMCYVPGPKAHAEFAAAHRGHKPATVQLPPSEAGEHPRRRAGPRQRRLKLEPMRDTIQVTEPKITEAPTPAPEIPVHAEFLSALVSRGITESAARKLLSNLKPDQQVIDQLEWAEHQVRINPGKYNNPAGFYIHLIEENVTVPASFETSRKRAAKEAEEHRRAEEERLQREYELYRSAEIDRYITEHSNEFSALKEAKVKDFIRRYGNDSMAERFATIDVRVEIGKNVTMLSFQEFVEAEKAIAAAQLAYQPTTGTDSQELANQGATETKGQEELLSSQYQDAVSEPVIDPIPPSPQTDLGSAL